VVQNIARSPTTIGAKTAIIAVTPFIAFSHPFLPISAAY
jgi:hypothetical protein